MGVTRIEHIVLGFDFQLKTGIKNGHSFFEKEIDEDKIDEDYVYEMSEHEPVYFIEDVMDNNFCFFGMNLFVSEDEYEGIPVTKIENKDFYKDKIDLIILKSKEILNLDIKEEDINIYVFSVWL